MAFGIYVHIPYCIQRCSYCDFTTFEAHLLPPPKDYLALLLREIETRAPSVNEKTVSSLYFGGGTPSLIEAPLILEIIRAIANQGFEISKDAEITIEINPATISEQKLEKYFSYGINRFSVGAQTFDGDLLRTCGRKHSASETEETLNLLKKFDANYSFDLLFALPRQTLSQLKFDLEKIHEFEPNHLSAYCLTVPEGHPMSFHRPQEAHQIEMFSVIEASLLEMGIRKYEISNFAKPGSESKHNQLYWSDQAYWGLGLSAHSFLKMGPYGTRFWNPKSWDEYARQVHGQAFEAGGSSRVFGLPSEQVETLNLSEAIFDFVYSHLRQTRGFENKAFEEKFGSNIYALTLPTLLHSEKEGFLENFSVGWRLTDKGRILNNSLMERFLTVGTSPSRSH